MPSGTGLILFVLLIAPGLLASVYISKTVNRKDRGVFDKSVESIIFALFAYICLYVLKWASGLIPDPSVILGIKSSSDLSAIITADVITAIASAGFLAIVLAIVWSKCLQWCVIPRILNTLKLSNRGPFESHWDDLMHEIAKNRWVSLKLTDGREFIGWLDSFSDGSDERSLSLVRVRKRIEDDKDGEPQWSVWPLDDRMYVPDAKSIVSMRLYSPVTEEKSS